MSGKGDFCQCRGACGKHERPCTTMFGNAHLFDGAVDEPMASKYGAGRRLWASCAPTFDPYRKQRERKAQQAYTEASTDRQREGEGLMEWHRRVHGR